MDNFFALFRRYLNDKAKGNVVYVYPSPPPIVNLDAQLPRVLTSVVSDAATGTASPRQPSGKSSTMRI